MRARRNDGSNADPRRDEVFPDFPRLLDPHQHYGLFLPGYGDASLVSVSPLSLSNCLELPRVSIPRTAVSKSETDDFGFFFLNRLADTAMLCHSGMQPSHVSISFGELGID